MITFYEQSVGFSHKASNKPCQDNGAHFSKDGIHVVIVCDGHGGESYVRSQVGSKLAAKVALKKVLDFIRDPDSGTLLSNRRGAVTAEPTQNLLKDYRGNKVEFSSLSEAQQDLVRQYKDYLDGSKKNPDLERSFRDLFKQIQDGWNEAIKEDAHEKPFSDEEKEKLGGKELQKAYGTTLMVAVRTPSYWLAFQIGDGKLLMCDKRMQWSEPVPWDCRCFFNITTSLCDNESVSEFRYAFDGTGVFPIAFVLGSDGIDGTYFQPELLHNFYNYLLKAFHTCPKEEALSFLQRRLSILSEQGSHDDMSVAAIIDENSLEESLKYYEMRSERDSINKEREERRTELKRIEEEHEAQLTGSEAEYRVYAQSCIEAWGHYCEMLKQREIYEKKVSELKNKWIEKREKEEETRNLLEKKKEEFDTWIFEKKITMNEYKVQMSEFENRWSVGSVDESNHSEETLPADDGEVKESSNEQKKETLNLGS